MAEVRPRIFSSSAALMKYSKTGGPTLGCSPVNSKISPTVKLSCYFNFPVTASEAVFVSTAPSSRTVEISVMIQYVHFTIE